ncbi:MAG: hypothetical protein U1F26_16280 [Lysobacterales bacterium]
MLSIRESNLRERNREIRQEDRQPGESNLAFLQRHWASEAFADAEIGVVLVGGRTSLDLCLRFAQSLARYDRSPSSWSEVFLIVRSAEGFQSFGVHLPAIQTPMAHQSERLLRNVPTWNNGIQTGIEALIDSPIDYPNIALLRLSTETRAQLRATEHGLAFDATAAIDQYRRRGDVISTAECAWRWLGYAWGIRGQGNPLHEGVGFPAAMVVDSVLNTLGLDLTPGLASHSSCPEAIWQTFSWWHTDDAAAQVEQRGPTRFRGVCCRSHVIDEA